MNNPSTDDDLDPAAARMVARVRAMMLIAGLTTMLAVAAVLVVIGYRFFTLGGSRSPSAAMADVTATLPKTARVVSTSAAGDRIVVTIEIDGRIEVRTFDLHSLKPAGRLRLVPEP
jgi:hypothetical protein